MVITCRRSDSGDVLSHIIHAWPSWLVRCCFTCPSFVSLPRESDQRFLARSSLVLLNNNRQLVWYFASFLLSVASIPPPSSSLAGSKINGSALISLNRGILVASIVYPSCSGTWWVGGEVRASFYLSFWQRQHLVQSVCLLAKIGFASAILIKAEGLSFYHLNQCTFLYEIWLGSGDLHLAQSFI